MSNGRTYRWEQSSLGGGGYITGLLQNPLDPDVLYARCDVAGVFRSRDRGKSWRAVNSGMTQCHHHSVQSFALNPHNPDILFRCSGEARNHTLIGTIHKSSDSGSSWKSVCEDAGFYGNGPTRMYGEVIGVSPHDGATVVAGGYSGGVWLSEDGGETFWCTGLRRERVGCITFHPQNPLCWYIGTIGDRVLLGKGVPADEGKAVDWEELLARYHDHPRSEAGMLYRTSDGGKTYDLCAPGLDFAGILIHPERPRELTACCIGDRIMQSSDGGKTFVPRSKGLPDGFRVNSHCRNPRKPDRLYAAVPMNRSVVDHPVILPVYVSEDNGETWKPLAENSPADFTDYPEYITPRHIGSALSKIMTDTEVDGRLYVSNWYGVSISSDRGKTWSGNGFTGLETVCGEDIFTAAGDTEVTETVYASLADHPPLYSKDSGEQYHMLDRIHRYSNSTACAVSRHSRGLFLYGMRNRNLTISASCIVRKEDSAAEIVFEPGRDTFVQNLKEDPFVPGRFWAVIDGYFDTAGIYRSDDWGKTFDRIEFPFPLYMKSLPHQKDFVESELLSVVVYQVKNVCGSNKTLWADLHKPGTLLFGEPTEGIFRTHDAGSTWKKLGDDLPFRNRKESVLTVIKGDPQRQGSIYAGFIREGLWHSPDWGESWKKVYPSNDEPFNVTAMDVGGKKGGEIVLACEPLFWSPVPSAVIWSGDLGKKWVDVTDPSLGALRFKGIAIEKNTGFLHGITCGNGCFRGIPE